MLKLVVRCTTADGKGKGSIVVQNPTELADAVIQSFVYLNAQSVMIERFYEIAKD